MKETREELICLCEDGGVHEEYVDDNEETVLICTECERFLKFPKE